MKNMIARLKAKSYRKRTVTPALKKKRKPGIRGEWIECRTCHAKDSIGCETCWERGSVWKSY